MALARVYLRTFLQIPQVDGGISGLHNKVHIIVTKVDIYLSFLLVKKNVELNQSYFPSESNCMLYVMVKTV